MSNSLSAELHEKIRIKAYLLWEKAGCPSGDGSNFWDEAEKVIVRMAKLTEAKRAKAQAAKTVVKPKAKPAAKAVVDPALVPDAKDKKKKKKEKKDKSDKKKSEKKKDKK